jgi:hypothetical protein
MPDEMLATLRTTRTRSFLAGHQHDTVPRLMLGK